MPLANKLDTWRGDLIDMTRRNPLLYYRSDGKRPSGIQFRPQDPGALFAQLAFRPRSIPHFEATPCDLEPEDLERRLKRLKARVREDEQDRGIRTLYLAFGMLEWYEVANSVEPTHSPLVFVPVTLNYQAATGSFTLKYLDDADCEINPTLREKLKHDFKIALPLWSDLVNDSTNSGGQGMQTTSPTLADLLNAIHTAIQDAISAHEGRRWRIQRDAVHLGRFAFQKLVMYQDLERHASSALAHPLLRVLGGDIQRSSLPAELPEPKEFDDRLRPHAMLEILDADSSQQEAILLAKSDVSFVLKGPPGTGKSQTIANIIAERLGQGKKVLFVSEKMAALEVVRKRLHDAGLGDFCLDLHSSRWGAAQKSRFISALKISYDDAMTSVAVDNDTKWQRQSSELQNRRDELNAYQRELHQTRNPLGRTAFDVYGELARLNETPDRDFPIANVGMATPAVFDTMTRAVDQLDACRDVLETYDTHPWRETRANTYSLELASTIHAHYTSLSMALRAQHNALSQIFALLGENVTVAFATMPFGADLAQAVLETQQPLRSWLSRETLARLRPLAADMLVRSATYGDQRRRFEAVYNRTLLTENLAALRLELTENSACAMGCLRDQAGTPQDTALSLHTELETQLQAASQSLASIPAAAQMLAEMCGIEQPETLGEISALLTAARHLLERPTLPPPAAWLDPSACAVARAIAAEAQDRYTQCARMRTALENVYQQSFFLLDLAGLRERFHTEYRSFFRILRAAYHHDIRLVKSQLLSGQTRTATQIEADITMAVKLLETEDALAEKRIEYAKTLDRFFDGAQTDWEQLTAALRWITRLHETMAGAPIPAKMTGLIAGPDKALRPVKATLDRLTVLFTAWEDAETFCLTNLQLTPLLQGAASFEEVAPAEAQAALQRLLSELRAFWLAADTVLRHHHMGPAARQPLLWATLCEDLECAQSIRDFEASLAAMNDDYTRDFGHFYQGIATNWQTVIEALNWTEGFLAHYTNRAIPEATATLVAYPGDSSRRDALQAALTTLRDTMQATNDGLKYSDKVVARTALNPPDKTFEETPLAELADRVDFLMEHLDGLERWLVSQQRIDTCRQVGLDGFVANLLSQRPIPPDISAIFRRRFYVLWLDHVRSQAHALKNFRGSEHSGVVEAFRALDANHKTLARRRLNTRLRLHRSVVFRATANYPRSELAQATGALRREMQKKRHGPIRKTVQKTAPALLELKPCWMMSPLSVSQFLESGDKLFDLVIFDEASQVCPEDSITSILRGSQLIVVGDPKQLPPTRFFAKSLADMSNADEDDEEEAEQDERTQSILDECLGANFETRSIEWHYRSADETLIAFSNHHFYNGQLVTFPSAHGGDNQGVRFEYVAEGVYGYGGTRKNRREADRVADIIFDFLRKHVGEEHPSLGVVALSAAQQDAISEALESRMKREPDLKQYEQFLSGDDPDGVFIKNLESVQGDERDTIILSVGYGRDAGGKVHYYFGPVNNTGGERRLNVAVTRARKQMIVVSSMKASDLPPNLGAQGARILRSYLEYAEACSLKGAQSAAKTLAEQPVGGITSGADPKQTQFDSPFEIAVYDALTARGLTLDTQVGCSGYRIDLAVRDPEHPGSYLLGIECDGATYHSSRTARDRDRLRQAQLEHMGWRLHRIWSSDWFANSGRETQRVLEAVAGAMKARNGFADGQRIAMATPAPTEP